jgi:transcription initiation factor TFIIIB Brf1 subunit/transcription initiation factor TFIIB
MKCPSCGKRYGIRVRIKTGEAVCNNCGTVDKKEAFQEKESKR